MDVKPNNNEGPTWSKQHLSCPCCCHPSARRHRFGPGIPYLHHDHDTTARGTRYGVSHASDTAGIRARVVSEAQFSDVDLSGATITVENGGPGNPVRVTVRTDFPVILGNLLGRPTNDLRVTETPFPSMPIGVARSPIMVEMPIMTFGSLKLSAMGSSGTVASHQRRNAPNDLRVTETRAVTWLKASDRPSVEMPLMTFGSLKPTSDASPRLATRYAMRRNAPNDLRVTETLRF